jgi:hypothetical protein
MVKSQSAFYSTCYLWAWKLVHPRPRLLRFIRIIRFSGRLGPWRNLIIKGLQRRKRNQPLELSDSSIFTELEIEQTVANINQAGYSLGLQLPKEYTERILEYCGNSRAKMYSNPHLGCEAIKTIAHDPKVVEIAKGYLGIEPILYGTVIYRTSPDSRIKDSYRTTKKRFHYDVSDFKSLLLFIYLTDVDTDCGPHVVIENTHQHKSLAQLINPSLSYETANERYGNRIKIITGQRGTGFFEDITTYHQHSIGRKMRLVLTIIYTLNRQPELLAQ